MTSALGERGKKNDRRNFKMVLHHRSDSGSDRTHSDDGRHVRKEE